MTRRTALSALSLACVTSALAFAARRPLDPVPGVPPDPAVPARVSLPPKNFTEPLTSDVKFEMVYVPGGEFEMGSPTTEAGRFPNEGPRRKVKVRPFWVGKFEITWDEYYAFWQDAALYPTDEVPDELKDKTGKLRPDAITRPTNAYVDPLYDHGRDGHPALCMSHHAAMMYCHWLRWKTKKGYRLPTEAEWEFACRGGWDGPYGFAPGDKLTDYAWFKENSGSAEAADPGSRRVEEKQLTTHKVGSKKPNKYGIHDMHGNVWEWCLDTYVADYFDKLPADKLALGPVTKPDGRKWSHTVRGGSWADGADKLRSACRRPSDPTWIKDDPQIPTSVWWLTKMDVIGFRVCLPGEEYPELADLKPLLTKKPEPGEVGIRRKPVEKP